MLTNIGPPPVSDLLVGHKITARSGTILKPLVGPRLELGNDPISKSNADRATNIRSKVVGSAPSQIGGAKNGRYRRHHRP